MALLYRRLIKQITIIIFIMVVSCATCFAQSPSHVQNKKFDKDIFSNVLATALIFLQPRTLDEHSIKEFCVWGLNGLNSLDPTFSIKIDNGQIILYQALKIIYTSILPPDNDLKSWVKTVTDMYGTAWDHSPSMQDAGQQTMKQAFFDELFDHMDPYSRYIGADSASTDRTDRDGGEAGAGISIKKKGNAIIITSVNTNGPAWAAGLTVGQRLYKVNDQKTDKQTIDTVKKWIKGPEKSPLSLTVGFPNSRKIKTIYIKRAAVPPATVFAFSSDNILILKVTSFSTSTAEEISQYLDQATQDMKLKGLIIDLRGNRGGVLQQAITTAALLLDHGVAATTQGRDSDANHVWAVQGGDLTNGIPIVILVDGHTASASEILSAALSDHKRAIIIGSSTLGKGLVQTIAQLPDNGELFITWSRVLAPLGWPLQGLGILPQVCTSKGQQSIQQQLQDLSTGNSAYQEKVTASRKLRFPISDIAIQKIRSACPAALGTDNDIGTAQKIILDPKLYKEALNLIPSE